MYREVDSSINDNMAILNHENEMFIMARQGKRLPGIIMTLAGLIIVVVLSFSIPTIFAEIAFKDMGGTEALEEGVFGLIIPFLMIVFFLWLWIAVYEKRSFMTLGFPLQKWIKKFISGLALGFGMIFLTVALMYAAGGVEFDNSGFQEAGTAALGGVVICLLIFIIQGSSEEIICRGWMLPVIGARYRPWIGVFVSTFIFTAFHGTLRPLAVTNLFLFSIFLSLYCLREGSIWGVCGMHSSWNWTQGHFFGLAVTGHEQSGGTVLDLGASGLNSVSGGEFGPEASIMCTLILGISISLLLVSMKAGKGKSIAAAQPPTG